jgi:L-iditol 2-dehydrogenase
MSTATMNALVLHAIGDARYEAIPLPEPNAGQVRVRVGFCGICNSDIPRMFGKGPYSLPLVCGHEFAGVVDRVGAGVTKFAPGDRVAVFPLLWCGNCDSCQRGHYAQCLAYDYLGSRSDGAFAEYVVAPARNLLPVSDCLSLEEAAMIEPAAVALHALRRAGGCSVGESVVVFGAGPIGLMVAQWARAMGAARVILLDLVREKLALARKLGFQHVIDQRDVDAVAVIEQVTGGIGADICVDAAGVSQATVQAMRAARHGGRIVLLGNPSGDVNIPAELISRMMRREVQIVGTWNSDYGVFGEQDDWHCSLAGMASGAIDVKPLVSHCVPLESAWGALNMIKNRTEVYCKVLIQPESGASRKI